MHKIPGKTFLVGEYAALLGMPAILLLTKPFFQIATKPQEGLEGIHPDSPAGIYWRQHGLKNQGLIFTDPYNGIGGMGASSAQFLGAYLACHKNFTYKDLLKSYHAACWHGKGLKPSGYDVLAQTSKSSCVYVTSNPVKVVSLDLAFTDLSLVLAHTGEKHATHEHLQQVAKLNGLNDLALIVENTKTAILNKDSKSFCASINLYAKALENHGFVTPSTKAKIKHLRTFPSIKAAKGCGALGADVILLVIDKNSQNKALLLLKALGLLVLS
ncbi:MAG: hypothetical protein A3F18_05805 [Legionellales bacterium RIFCSPHIGHO2_12_FULL_37_14]|nr:MAG: hypothetical protein A3F18_05805 [Legionellales bacterium RIFCSPHIGHO2_12_FULL_37_14]